MRRLRQWLIWLTTSLTRRHDETRLREEIDDHVAFETDANLRRGMPPAEARRRALLTFGSMETFKENYRDQQGVRRSSISCRTCGSRFGGCGRRPASRPRRSSRWRLALDWRAPS